MTDFVKLYMSVDATGMTAGDQAMDQLVDKAANTETRVNSALDSVGRKAKTSMDKTARSVADSVKAMDRAAPAAQKVSAGLNGAAQQAKVAGAEIKSAAGHTANLTSQFNDIAVMMAAGQNPIQLAMQQGTQITQVLQQMGGGIGAVKALGGAFLSMVSPLSLATLGIIALGAASSQWLFTASDGAKKLEDHIDDLKSSLDSYTASAEIANGSTGEAAAKFGLAATQAMKFHKALAAISRMSIDQSLKSAGEGMLEKMGANFGRDGGIFANERGAADFFNLGGVDFGERAKKTRAEVRGLISDLRSFNDTTDVETRIVALSSALERVSEFAARDGKISAAEQELIDSMSGTMEVLLTLRKEEAEIATSRIHSAQALYVQLRLQGEAMAAQASEEIDALNRQAHLNRLIAIYGENSVAVSRARLQAERDAKLELVQSEYGAGNLANALMEAWDNANGIASVDMDGKITLATSATWNWADAMGSVASEVSGILSAISALGGGMISNAGKFVELEALKAGKSASQAARARKEYEINNTYGAKEATAGNWVERLAVRSQKAVELRSLELDEELGVLRGEANERDRKSRSSGGGKRGGGRTRENEYERSVMETMQQTEAFLAQADAMAKVAASGGDWERALAVIEEKQALLNAAQKAGVALTPEVIAQIDALAEGYVSAEEKLDRLRQSTERGRDAFKDLFGAALEGADAFQDALGNLLAEMAKVQFQKGMLGLLGQTSWGGGLISAVGGLLSFDGGGYTGDGPRSGGLDGKGGKLAMIHPQETVIDHTKGGGGAISMSASELTITDSGQIMAKVRAEMTQGINSYDRRLADRVNFINTRNPRLGGI